MSKIKLNVLGKCPYCGAPNTKKINETEYLCNHCGQTSFIEKDLDTYDSSNLNLKDIIVKSNSNKESELEKTVSYLVKLTRLAALKVFSLIATCFKLLKKLLERIIKLLKSIFMFIQSIYLKPKSFEQESLLILATMFIVMIALTIIVSLIG